MDVKKIEKRSKSGASNAFVIHTIEKITLRHKASLDLMRGQSEWGDRNTERKVWNLVKFQVVQRREKIGRNRRNTKVTGLEETKRKGKKKKKQARKDGGDWFSVDPRKAASAVFPAGAPYLIRVAWDVKGWEDETGLASERERGNFNTVFQGERPNFSVQRINRTTS